jgi:mannose-6-phosphate isomerase-like protein (cupin superfamily)
MKIGKKWGVTELILNEPYLAIHRLTIKCNAACSEHVHDFKYNAFLCVKGRLFIDVWKNDYKLVDTTVLEVGDFTTVKPKEFHRFRTENYNAIAIELYYLAPLSEDIIRRSVGTIGKKK